MIEDDSDVLRYSCLCWEKDDHTKWLLKCLKRNWRMFEGLTDDELQWSQMNLQRTGRVFVDAIKKAHKQSRYKILTKPVSEFVVTDRFRYDKHLRLTEGIGIGEVSEQFETVFDGRIERNVPPVQLVADKVNKPLTDAAVIHRYGGMKNIRIELAQAYEYLRVAGPFRTYHFYVEDSGGVLWAVDAKWTIEDIGSDGEGIGDEWEIEAYPIAKERRISGYIIHPEP